MTPLDETKKVLEKYMYDIVYRIQAQDDYKKAIDTHLEQALDAIQSIVSESLKDDPRDFDEDAAEIQYSNKRLAEIRRGWGIE